MRRIVLLLGLICGLAATGWAAAIQVTAELNPADFAADQGAVFVITVNGSSSAQPELPIADGLHFRALGQSQQTSWVNGQVSAAVSFRFAVQADKPGQYTIGPVKVRVDGTEYSTKPLRCTVSGSGSSTAIPPASGPNAAPLAEERIGFMRIQLEKDTFYAGQLMSFTIKAYFRQGNRIHIKTAPRLTNENFLLHALDNEPTQQQERMQGELFTVLTWHGWLSAVKEGTAPLAVDVAADLMVPQPRSTLSFDSPFLDDPLLDDFFGNSTRREVKFASPEKSVTARPLPMKNRPADFKGAVGTFSLAVAAAPTDGKLGEPVTLKMKITGSGNFDRVQSPELTDSTGWKVYPPADSFTGQGGKGEKTFEQAAVPVSSSLNSVPPLRFSYFDPAAGDYVTLTSEPIPLRLQNVVEPAPSVQPQPEQKVPPPVKPHYIAPPFNPVPGESVQFFQPLYQQRRFQMVMAGAACCLATGLLLDVRRKRLESNPGPARRKQAERQLARHCQAMRAAINVADQEQFRQHCLEAVRQWTGVLWDRNAAAITLADLHERLPANAPVLAVFVRLEESGYAGAALTPTEMETMLETVRQELVKLT
jgi:hypothetical protein